MADEPNQEVQESDLERYIEKEPGEWHQLLGRLMQRAPWWAVSALVHVVALLLLSTWHMPGSAEAEVVATIIIGCPVPPDEPVPPSPTVPDDVDPATVIPPFDPTLPIEDTAPSPEPASKSRGTGGGTGGGDGTGEGPGVGPGASELEGAGEPGDDQRPVPSIDPPSNTRTIGPVDPSKKSGPAQGSYTGRKKHAGGFVPGGGGGTTRLAESTATAGLIWLAKAQEKDGSWSCRKWEGNGDFDVAMTGLALLAFLGGGYTNAKGSKFNTTVEKGLEWLRANQQPNGSFGWKTFYEQGIATMAVSEAYGLTQSPAIGRMAQRAIDYIVKTQPEHGGFRYQGAVDKENGDMSVTGWQIMSLKSAICSELKVPQEAVERSRVFLKNTLREYGGSAYTVGTPGATPAMTAIGMLCRQFLGGDFDADIRAAAEFLRKAQAGAPGAPGSGKDHLVGDLYYTYYSTLAMFQMGGEYWFEWNKLFRDPLVKCQVTQINDAQGRFVRGSWEPKNHFWAASAGGRVYATAMAVISLEVYYRYLPVYKK